MSKPVTYGEYLALDELLGLQRPLSDGPEHDELLFITIHQVYELWFQQILHEVGGVGEALQKGDGTGAAHGLRRVRTIMKTLVGQVDILETMTPLGFQSFRERLRTASGFQSFQFRELEFALGKKDPLVLDRFPEGSAPRVALERRFREASLWDRFLHYLHASFHALPEAVLARDVTERVVASAEMRPVLKAVYEHEPAAASLCELLVDIDEGLQEWRYRHVMMVRRTIGSLPGTGGSAGVAYLKKTLFEPLFPDLWDIRDSFGKIP